MSWEGKGSLRGVVRCARCWYVKCVEDDGRSQETGNLSEGARQSSFEKLRFGKLEFLLEYCVLHDTTHQDKEQGVMAHGDSWE